MGGESESKSRWEGEASVEVKGMNEEQVWSILKDFCNVHKWIPIDTCYRVEGEEGQPGVIRYCAATVTDQADPQKTVFKWATEKLLVTDPIQRCQMYEIVDSNMGFKSFVATMKVLGMVNGGCKIKWGFVCDPLQEKQEQEITLDGLLSYIQYLLTSMANKMESVSNNY